MPLVLRFAARSDVGRVRSKNDDSAYAGRHLAVVADGMGGHVGGDVASASTVLDLAALDATGYEDPATVLPDEIQNANLILNDLVHATPKLAGMGTTCTAVLLAGETLHVAHIGDSRAYRLKDGVFEQVSVDHTFVQRLVDEGRLDPSEAENHPHKNVLMRVLGDVDASPELDLMALAAAPGERWLLCSDGLTAVVPSTVIEHKLRHRRDLQAVADELVELTLAGGAPDNVTVVAFEVAEATPEETSEPAPVPLSERALAAATPDGAGPVSGSLLREDLESRPHVLVGAAAQATQTGKIPIVTRRSTQKRAATLLSGTDAAARRPEPPLDPLAASAASDLIEGGRPAGRHRAAPAGAGQADGGPAGGPGGDGSNGSRDPGAAPPGAPVPGAPAPEEDEPVRRRRSVFLPVFTALLALILAVVLTWSYLWTQTQYYVGAHEGRVAIYNGVSQRLGPITLSHLDSETEVRLEDLPAYSRQRVEAGLPARDLEHAQEIVADLEGSTTSPPADGPTASPDASASPRPSASPSPTGGTARATTSPSGTPSPSGSTAPRSDR
ncbi:serine/threonine-protein phosphatase [Citricoccus sp. SGAir0253]|uniref:PP2C family protein-serine/threonine phosphatase n=1 Tax=Citricoccus sp. SGAir0253 TaxID=2567881 RepID=UPI0010CCD069|nr:protein phosphatase 2C domain-containing protein [Citricoccus sp. SGAir0253]QCU76815.1 serine/threonine-protein phosphatase [Citricoccus sp. SGAir0253]